MGLLQHGEATPLMAPEASVIEAVRLMTDRNVGSIAVVEGRRCVGIFTERDLMRRVVFAGRRPETTALRDVMSRPVVSVADDMSVAKAAALMRQHHIRHLAVVDAGGELLGVVALRYLLYAMLDDLDAKANELEGYLMADAPGG